MPRPLGTTASRWFMRFGSTDFACLSILAFTPGSMPRRACFPSPLSFRASLAAVVVFPEPCEPTSVTTVNGTVLARGPRGARRASPATRRTGR
jgi:hypothetical protein